jgi:hypothetical protein
MPQWVSIAQAIKLTGKSENTIRRLIYELQKTNKELATKVISKSPTGAYQIETTFLQSRYPLLSTNENPMSSTHGIPTSTKSTTHETTQTLDPVIKAKDETIAVLKSQLEKQTADYKEQLNRRDEQMKMLLERMRENNIILQGLTLPSPQKEQTIEPAGVVTGTKESNPVGTRAVPMDNSSEQPKEQPMSTKAEQKDQEKKHRGKPASRKSQKSKSTKQEKPKKKGFFSFLTGK